MSGLNDPAVREKIAHENPKALARFLRRQAEDFRHHGQHRQATALFNEVRTLEMFAQTRAA